MRVLVGESAVELVQGDITEQQVTAIDYLRSSQAPLEAKFVLFDSGAYQVFVTVLQQLAGEHTLECLDG